MRKAWRWPVNRYALKHSLILWNQISLHASLLLHHSNLVDYRALRLIYQPPFLSILGPSATKADPSRSAQRQNDQEDEPCHTRLLHIYTIVSQVENKVVAWLSLSQPLVIFLTYPSLVYVLLICREALRVTHLVFATAPIGALWALWAAIIVRIARFKKFDWLTACFLTPIILVSPLEASIAPSPFLCKCRLHVKSYEQEKHDGRESEEPRFQLFFGHLNLLIIPNFIYLFTINLLSLN